MGLLDDRMISVLAAGLLSSILLLSAASVPPCLSVSEVWALGGDATLTVSGLVVSLRSYETGSESLVLADPSGSPTVRVICSPGPGPPPSASASVGDMTAVSGECVFEDGVPVIFCRYGDVRVMAESEEALTVSLLGASWRLFEGDRFSVRGVCSVDPLGAPRLTDPGGGCSFALLPDPGVAAVEGDVIVDCTLVVDRSTMSVVLEAHAVAPTG
jgi:hypothetical protein